MRAARWGLIARWAVTGLFCGAGMAFVVALLRPRQLAGYRVGTAQPPGSTGATPAEWCR